jgi:hypothetical protein
VRRREAAWVVAALVVLAGGARALAHPPPEGSGLYWVPVAGGASASSSAEHLFIRTQRGFLVQSSTTNDFRLLCNLFTGVQDGEDASFANLGGGAAIMTTYAKGALIGSSDGCTWSPVTSVMTTPAYDVAVTGVAPNTTAYIVGGTPDQGDHFWAGQHEATNWSTLANTDQQPYTRVRVAASNPNRLYVSGISLTASAMAIHRLGVSDDGGKTIVDRTIALGPSDLQARVLDVDRLHPDHIYVYVESTSDEIAERVIVSDDAGQSFTTAVTLHAIAGFAQSDDGARVWIGGKEGIYRSIDGGHSFAPVASPMTTVTCLAFHNGHLYGCGFLNNQLMVALSDDDGDTFNKIMSFDQVTQAADCPQLDPNAAPSTVCASDIAHWRLELGTVAGGAPADGGAAAGTGGQSPGDRSSPSGCDLAGGDQAPGSAARLIVVLAAAGLGRLRGRRSRVSGRMRPAVTALRAAPPPPGSAIRESG